MALNPNPQSPPAPPPPRDLTDAEFAELDALLAATPEPLEPLDVVMLDGYLCGVIVQPVLLEPATWLAHVFDFDARPLPEDVDPAWHARTMALVLRRHAVLNRALAEQGWFDPLILEPDDESDAPEPGEDPVAEARPDGASASSPRGRAAEDAAEDRELVRGDANTDADADAAGGEGQGERGLGSAKRDDDTGNGRDAQSEPLGAVAQAVMPWVAGFSHATATFPDLDELPDDAVGHALARLYRHLPAETDEERELIEMLDREQPLADLDDAIEDLVAAVADLYDLTREQRYKVDTVRREAPKVGRNEPCPCGSGKKFKQCHGGS